LILRVYAGMSESHGLLSRMTDRTRKVVHLSAAFSRRLGHREIDAQDLLDALAHMGGISDVVLSKLGYSKKEAPEPDSDAERRIEASECLRTIVAEAHEQARSLGHSYVGTEHLLLAMAQTNPSLVQHYHRVRAEILALLGHGI
jgi:ATP-dependent Clp protease ATP-binding subunit ClpC